LRAGQRPVGPCQVVHGHAHRLKQRDRVSRFPVFLHSGGDSPEFRVSRVAPDNIPPDAVGVKSSRRKAGPIRLPDPFTPDPAKDKCGLYVALFVCRHRPGVSGRPESAFSTLARPFSTPALYAKSKLWITFGSRFLGLQNGQNGAFG